MTAAFVLLCSVYCACGGVVPAGHGPVPGRTERQTAAACTAHCHGHDHGRTPAQSEPDGPPGSGHSGHAGCGHCNPVLSILELSSGLSTPHAPAWAAAVLLVPCPAVEMQSIRPAYSINQDLPPPTSAPTLLSLHCALNT